MTDVKRTQIRAVFGGAVFIEDAVSLVSEMENKYESKFMAVRRIIPIDSKAFTLTTTEANLLHANQICAPCDIE